MERAARVMATATKRARTRKRARRRVRAICNSVFGAPKIIFVEPMQKKAFPYQGRHKSQITNLRLRLTNANEIWECSNIANKAVKLSHPLVIYSYS
jgi:hypothetical protein